MSMANGPQSSPVQRPRTSGLAVASLVLSCMAILIGTSTYVAIFMWPFGPVPHGIFLMAIFVVCPLGFLPGIICGHLARRDIWKTPRLKGDGLAFNGLAIGYFFLGISVFLCICILVGLLIFFDSVL